MIQAQQYAESIRAAVEDGVRNALDVASTSRRQLSHVISRRSWSYEEVKQGETDDDHVPAWKRAASQQPRRLLLLVGTAIVLVLVMMLQSGSSDIHEPFSQNAHRYQDHKLYVIMPSSEPDSELCKSVLTAGVLGYPTPVVINYNATFDESGRASEREQHTLEMLSGYFNRMGSSSDSDIAIVLDTPYSWFQLRPEVLLSRYYEANRKANDWLRKLFSADEVTFGRIKQEVIFSVNRDRLKTDLRIEDDQEPSNSATLESISAVMGPIGSLRAIYRQAVSKAEVALGDIDSQVMLSEIFEQQELRRQSVQQQYRSSKSQILQHWRSIVKSWSGRSSSEDLEVDDGKDHEFGIGLDYINELSLSVDQQDDADISASANRAHIPEDIATSTPPYWTPSGNHPLVHKKWEAVPLVMHRHSKTVPVIVSFPDRDTEFRRAHWANFWMQPGLKEMFREALTLPRLPIASVLDATNTEHLFWDGSVRFDRAGILTTEGGWAAWDGICERDDTWDLAEKEVAGSR